MEFIPSDDLEDNPYTGVFRGSKHAIIRLSNADLYVEGVSKAISPSIGIKFLRTGQPSANYLGMVSFEDTGSFNFFENDFSNHLPKHEGDCGPQTIGRFHSKATRFIYQNGNSRLATHAEDGSTESSILFPFQLKFSPIKANLPITDDTEMFYDTIPLTVPENTHMFDVWALDMPES